MDAELKSRIKEILEGLSVTNDKDYKTFTLTGGSSSIDYSARDYLLSKGCLVERPHSYAITAAGYDYLEELNTWTPWYWFRNNWFPAIVALMTILTGLGTLLIQAAVALRG